jgi:hypothetical protein
VGHRLISRAAGAYCVLALALATPAAARLGGGPPAGTPSPPTGGTSTGSDGGYASADSGNCHFYVTPSSYGLACVSGGSRPALTVARILGKDDPPTCWDRAISDSDLRAVYQYEPVDGLTYYLHTCLSGLDLDRPLSYQPRLNVSQSIVEIASDAPRCARPFRPEQVGSCVMWLTARQQLVAQALVDKHSQIPNVVLQYAPSSQIITHAVTTYSSAGGAAAEPVNVGSAVIAAHLVDQYLEPYGPGAGPRLHCDLAGTGRGVPCRWAYPRSSAGQPDQVYALRAAMVWTVSYSDRTGTHTLATFTKYADALLPVRDVQVLGTN